MRAKGVLFVILIVLGASIVPLSTAVFADDPPRRLSIVPDENQSLPFADLERKLRSLKNEQNALEADLKALPRREKLDLPSLDRDQLKMQMRLKEILHHLEERKKRPKAQPTHPDNHPKKDDDAGHKKEVKPEHPEEKHPAKSSGEEMHSILDPLSLGHALFQVEEYAEALTSFRRIDLKAKKPDERAPIQYLMACCQENLGKYDEAFELLREAGNSHDDQQVASVAQWHLAMLRWRRNTLDQLQTLRNRRIAPGEATMIDTTHALQQRLADAYTRQIACYRQALAVVVSRSDTLEEQTWVAGLQYSLSEVAAIEDSIRADKAAWNQTGLAPGDRLRRCVDEVAEAIQALRLAVDRSIEEMQARKHALFPQMDQFIRQRQMLQTYAQYGKALEPAATAVSN